MNMNKWLSKYIDTRISENLKVWVIVFEGFARWRCGREDIRGASNIVSIDILTIVQKYCKLDARKSHTTITGHMSVQKIRLNYKTMFRAPKN